MLVSIDSIIVNDRIRKDYGNIQELADDIRENGLINPPVVNQDNVLLAGERRLRACKMLGWPTIDVHQMDTRDAEHELNIEISENESRKEFSKAERVDYMKRLMRIESAKAKERQGERNDLKNIPQKSAESHSESREVVASQFGISRDTMKKEMSIVDHKELLDPADFAEWDEGKLSTNKVYLRLKAKLKELEEENKALEEDCTNLRGNLSAIESEDESELREILDQTQDKLESISAEKKALEDKVKALEARKPETVTVEKEVIVHADQKEIAEKNARIKELEEQLAKAQEPEEEIFPDLDSPEKTFGAFISAYSKFNSTAAFFQPSRNGFESLDKATQQRFYSIIAQMEGLLEKMKACSVKEEK